MSLFLKHIGVTAFFFICMFGKAQDERLQLTVDRNPVGMNDQVILKITLKNASGRLERPDLSSFTVLQGPLTSNSTQNVNGKVTREYSETFVLRPRAQGTYKIGPARAAVENEVLVSNVIDLKVQQGSAPNTSANTDFFARVEVSKKSVYVGEGLQVLFKIFSVHENIERIDQADYPELVGFWSEEIAIDRVNWESRKEVVNGKAYSVATLRKQIVYPQQSGDLKIGAFDISCVARISRGFWDTRKERYSFSTPPVTIKVKPLPSGKPDNFLGTFDNLSLTLTADRNELKTNEAIDVNLKFSGKGNFKTLGNVTLEFPDDFELYEPTVKDNLSLTDAGQSGSRIFNYVVIPRVPGQFSIEGIKYSWFDFKTGTYRILDPGALQFNVEKGSDSQVNSYSINPKSQVNILTSDIRYIITQVDCLTLPGRGFFMSVPYYGVMAGVPVLSILFIFMLKMRERKLADSAGMRRSKAARSALKTLNAAKKLTDDQTTLSVLSALEKYVTDKFGILPGTLDNALIKTTVEKHSNQEIAEAYAALHVKCQMGRYAQTGKAWNSSEVIEQAEQLIRKIERGQS